MDPDSTTQGICPKEDQGVASDSQNKTKQTKTTQQQQKITTSQLMWFDAKDAFPDFEQTFLTTILYSLSGIHF